MRKLATIQQILKIEPIPKADNIVKVTIKGWECVAKKEDFEEGDPCVYFEIDSILPDHPVFEFMRSRKFKVKTAKFMKQISQGLVMPTPIIPKITGEDNIILHIDMDVTELLGVRKHDPQAARERQYLRKDPKRNPVIKYMLSYHWFRKVYFKVHRKNTTNFPWFLKKTDEERIQNIPNIFLAWDGEPMYEMEKFDGCSGTFAFFKEKGFFNRILSKDFYTCSRNLTLYKEDKSEWWETARLFDIKNKLESVGKNIAVQGEIVGVRPNGAPIQGNRYKIKGVAFYIFNVIDIDENNYYNLEQKLKFCEEYGFTHAPVGNRFTLSKDMEVNDMINLSMGKSTIADIHKEGIVIRSLIHDRKSFKAINPDFLLKYDS